MQRRSVAAVAVASIAIAVPAAPNLAVAQETSTTALTPGPGHFDEFGNWVPPVRDRAPDTDSCPNAQRPSEAMSTSERLAPGQPTPTPPPQVYDGPCGVIVPPGYAVPSDVYASAWAVFDADSGEVLAMKDPHGRYRPASIIKVLLALVVINELPLDQQVPVSEASANQEGSRAGIGAGGTYTVNDLLHGLLMASGNDTAHALAQAIGGDDAALRKVNALAQDLGMRDTYVASYSGLDAPGMSTSAWDLSLAYRAAFQNQTFASIVDTDSYEFPGFDDLPGFQLWNDNQLYLNDPEGIGGKTGYTDDANHTFVGGVHHDGRRLVAVLLDTTVGEHRAWGQAQELLAAAYPVAAGQGVASLDDATAPSTSPSTTPLAPGPDEGASTSTDAQKAPATTPWKSIGIVAGVAVLALVALVLSLGSRGTPPRHRRRR
nr:D-alanyl-D-alanine carboxypeptidase family protein [Corynebacterium sp. NML 120412]